MPQNEQINPKDGWALFAFIAIALVGLVWFFSGSKEEPEPIVQQPAIVQPQPIQYHPPETKTVYIPQPTQHNPQPAPPINISIIIDGEKITTPPIVEQGVTEQRVVTPKQRVKQSNPHCDQMLEEHERRIAEWSNP